MLFPPLQMTDYRQRYDELVTFTVSEPFLPLPHPPLSFAVCTAAAAAAASALHDMSLRTHPPLSSNFIIGGFDVRTRPPD